MIRGAGRTLTRLFDYLQRMIDVVVANPDGFNDYVAHHLPYQQRTGRIARKDLDRIVPELRVEVEDREMAIKALEDSVHGHSAPSFGNHDHPKVLHLLPHCQRGV